MGKLGKAFLFLLTVMLLLTALSRAASSFTVAQVRVEQPEARRIVHTVSGEGLVEKMEEQPVYAAEDVLVDEVKVKEGQTVKKGDVLAVLDADSIDENIRRISDEIEELRLQNEAIAARERQEAGERGTAKERAREDYDSAVSEGEALSEEAKEQVRDAKQKVKEAKEQADEAFCKKCEELEEAVETAKKAYETALGQEKSALLAAKRAVEDAEKVPANSYEIERIQMEITQKQRRINELYRDIWTSEEDSSSIEEQIRAIQAEISALQLQLKAQTDAEAKRKEEREQAIARAKEDYENTAETYAALVNEAKQAWDDAQLSLDEFLADGAGDSSQEAAVKAAEEALKNAKRQREEQERQQEERERQARRALEDSSKAGAADNSAAINQLAIAQKERQLALLREEKERGGKVVSEVDGTVTSVLLSVGQRSSATAAFLMSDASGGMSFTTQIGKEDAEYVLAGDTVSLKCGEETYEDLSVLSVETNEDETVQVTVYVPRDTLALGAFASMELTKQSQEYRITVPISAIHTINERNYVYVMEPEESVLGGTYVAMQMEVTVVEKNGMYAAISESSLTDESQIITTCDQMISAGETVRLLED